MISLAFWSWLVDMGILPDGSFIQPASSLSPSFSPSSFMTPETRSHVEI